MEVLEDGMDMDMPTGPGVDYRAKAAAYRAAAASTAAGIVGRGGRRGPPVPLSVPAMSHRADGNGVLGAPPSPQSGGGGGGLSPLSARAPYENGNGRGGGPDRGVAGPMDLASLQQLFMQHPAAFNRVPPSVMLRLLMQAPQAASGGAGIAASNGGGGIPQGTPRSSSGGSVAVSDRPISGGGGAGQSCLTSACNGVPAGGGERSAMEGPSYGKTAGGGGGLAPAAGDGHQWMAFRPHNGGVHSDAYPANPPGRGSSGGVGRGGVDVETVGSGKGLPPGGLKLSTDALRTLLANGSFSSLGAALAGMGGVGGHVSEPGPVSFAQLQSLLQHFGGIGGSAAALLAAVKDEGAGGAQPPAPLVQQLLVQLAAANGGGDGAGGFNISAFPAANGGAGGGGSGLEALAGMLKLEGGGKGGCAGVPPGPQPAAQSQLLQQVLQHGGLPNGLSQGAALGSMLAGLPLPGLGSLVSGGGSGAGGALQPSHHHLLPVGVGANGRVPTNGLDALVDDPIDIPSASAAAAAAAAAAAIAVAAREATTGGNSGDGRGGGGGGGGGGCSAGVSRGNSRPQRHSSSELSGGGNSKGPTGLQLLKNLVISGAANAGVAGLMNGSGGLADLSVMPGAVATQLMEDLELLGYRPGAGGSVIGGHCRRGSGGAGGCPVDAGVRLSGGAGSGQGAASGASKSRFVPPASTSPGSKKPNKRPENGSLATQILKRQRHALAMQQVSGSDSASACSGPSASLPVVPPPLPPPPPTSLLSAADASGLLGPGGAGLGGLVSAGAVPGLAGMLGGLPPAAVAAAAAGLPPVAATAALLASQSSGGGNSTALVGAAALARKGGGLSALNGGAGEPVLGGLPGAGHGATAGGGAPAGGPLTGAQLRSLALARLPSTATAAALLAAARGHGLGASMLLGQHVPKGRRSRRCVRPTGPMKMRNIMKDLGIHLLRRAPGEAWQPERETRTDPAQRSGSSGGGSDTDGAAGLSAPPMRRQRTNQTLTAAPAPPAAAVTAEAAGMAIVPAARASSKAGPRDQQGDSPMTDKGGACASAAVVEAVGAGGILNGAFGGASAFAGLNWQVLARSSAAGVPLVAAVAKAFGLQGSEAGGGTAVGGSGGGGLTSGPAAAAALRSAAQAAAAAGAGVGMAANKPGSAVNSTANGGTAAAIGSGLLSTRPAPAAAASTGAGGPGRGATGGQASGPSGKSGAGGAAAKAAAAASGPNGGAPVAAAAAAVTGKSRRKGGAPSRAAD